MSEYSLDESDTALGGTVATELRALIRARVRSGRLPNPHGHRLFGGKGDGTLCACCDRFITSAEIQFDIDSPQAGGWQSQSMHLECFDLWRSESDSLRARRTGEAEGRAAALPL